MNSFSLKNFKIGIDIVEVSRFKDFDKSSRLAKNIFTLKEIEQCAKKKNIAESLAARFAAKEAVKKTITENVGFNEIEITNKSSGAPQAVFLREELQNRYELIISISHVESIAQAVCLTYKK